MVLNNVSDVHRRATLPDCQRLCDEAHINEIYESIAKDIHDGREPYITGCLITAILDDQYYLLDGNHRLQAYHRIFQEHGHDLVVYVQEIYVTSMEEVESLFRQLNKSLPISSLPSGVKRSSVNKICSYFYDRYGTSHASSKKKPLFSNSTTVHRPRVSKLKFEEIVGHLVQLSIPEERIISEVERHIQTLNRKTYEYFRRYTNDTTSKLRRMVDTADVFGCRLGMINLSCELPALFSAAAVRGIIQRKTNIPKSLKIAVWNRYMGLKKREGQCLFCKSTVCIESFHCAHDEAEAHGGDINIDNLFPCCGDCNLSMGKKSFEEFIVKFSGNLNSNVT